MLSEADLLRRQKFVTSYDAAAIVGLSDFGRTKVEVFWDKVSKLAPQKQRKEWDFGTRLEDVLVEWGADRLGGLVFQRQQWVESIDGLTAATLDGLIVDRPEAFEAKTSGSAEGWGEEGTDQIPQGYLIQAQHQCHVANLERVWVPALISSYRTEFRLYCVTRNEALITSLIREERRFWTEHVEPRIPPDGNPTPPVEFLKAMRRLPGTTVQLDHAAAVNWAWLNDARAACTEAEKRKKEIEAVVLAQLGDAEIGTLPDGSQLRYTEEGAGHSTDTVLLRALNPKLYEQVVTPRTRRVLRIKKPTSK